MNSLGLLCVRWALADREYSPKYVGGLLRHHIPRPASWETKGRLDDIIDDDSGMDFYGDGLCPWVSVSIVNL